MTATLRPMSLGEILDRTFEIYRSAFLAFLGVALLPFIARMAVYLLAFLANGFIGQTTLTASSKGSLTGAIDWFGSRVADGWASFLIWPIFALMAAQIVSGSKLNIRTALGECLVRWRSWLVFGGCFWLIDSELPRQLRIHFLLHAWLAIQAWLRAILTTLEGFALVAPLLLSMPIWSIEKTTVSNAIARSWTLSRRAYGKMFIAWLLNDVLVWSIGLMLNFLTYILLIRQISGLYENSFTSPISFLISLPVCVSTAVTAPLVPIALTVIYYDQRIRLEGMDIELMMDAAGMNAPVPADTAQMQIASALVERSH